MRVNTACATTITSVDGVAIDHDWCRVIVSGFLVWRSSSTAIHLLLTVHYMSFPNFTTQSLPTMRAFSLFHMQKIHSHSISYEIWVIRDKPDLNKFNDWCRVIVSGFLVWRSSSTAIHLLLTVHYMSFPNFTTQSLPTMRAFSLFHMQKIHSHSISYEIWVIRDKPDLNKFNDIKNVVIPLITKEYVYIGILTQWTSEDWGLSALGCA